MKVLLINKFLHPNGGSETYVFKIGEWLEQKGHEVQYFGMEHSGRCVGNRIGAYTADMDLHSGSGISLISNSIKVIYSSEARKKIRMVLEDFRPDVCHINNFNFQLTPSIILEIKKWNKNCRIVYTAHDYMLVCPNHMCHNPGTHENCEKCLGGHYLNCVKGRCIHGSVAKSFIGAAEAFFWKGRGVYRSFDRIICCSEFLKKKMDSNPIFAAKTEVMHNFIDNSDEAERKNVERENTERENTEGENTGRESGGKKDYVLYFGRFTEEKGIGTLLEAAKELKDIRFVFVGSGPLESEIDNVKNIKNAGFRTGEALKTLIREAKFSVYPSEWYENCPFSVMESQMYGTPVLGADIGGIPELIQPGRTGDLFESGNKEDLIEKIKEMSGKAEEYSENCKTCKNLNFDTLDDYGRKLLKIYCGGS